MLSYLSNNQSGYFWQFYDISNKVLYLKHNPQKKCHRIVLVKVFKGFLTFT